MTAVLQHINLTEKKCALKMTLMKLVGTTSFFFVILGYFFFIALQNRNRKINRHQIILENNDCNFYDYQMMMRMTMTLFFLSFKYFFFVKFFKIIYFIFVPFV